MTPEELRDIRARDAAPYGVSADVVRLIEDRRALLTALDEANAECARATAEVDMLRELAGPSWAEHHEWMGALKERARIRAAVEGLPKMHLDYDFADQFICKDVVDRAAVLAAIDGGEKKPEPDFGIDYSPRGWGRTDVSKP